MGNKPNRLYALIIYRPCLVFARGISNINTARKTFQNLIALMPHLNWVFQITVWNSQFSCECRDTVTYYNIDLRSRSNDVCVCMSVCLSACDMGLPAVSLRRSTLFPLISLFILLAGEIVALMSHYDRRKKVLTFVSGILFVIAGK